MNKQIHEALLQFGLTKPDSIEIINDNLFLINNFYFLKHLKNPQTAAKVKSITDFLRNDGLTVPLCLNSMKQGNDFILMERMTGLHLKFCDIPHENIFIIGNILGKEIAELHQSLKKICYTENEDGTDLISDFQESLHIIELYKDIVAPDILSFCRNYQNIYRMLPKQLIHRDIQFRNLLFCNDGYVGFLDFDSCEINVRSYDLAYFFLCILSENVRDLSFQRSELIDFIKAIFNGYQQAFPLSPLERKEFSKILIVIQICFISYYAKNDLSSNNIAEQIDLLNWIFIKREEFI